MKRELTWGSLINFPNETYVGSTFIFNLTTPYFVCLVYLILLQLTVLVGASLPCSSIILF
jgi:hypothetical protein